MKIICSLLLSLLFFAPSSNVFAGGDCEYINADDYKQVNILILPKGVKVLKLISGNKMNNYGNLYTPSGTFSDHNRYMTAFIKDGVICVPNVDNVQFFTEVKLNRKIYKVKVYK